MKASPLAMSVFALKAGSPRRSLPTTTDPLQRTSIPWPRALSGMTLSLDHSRSPGGLSECDFMFDRRNYPKVKT